MSKETSHEAACDRHRAGPERFDKGRRILLKALGTTRSRSERMSMANRLSSRISRSGQNRRACCVLKTRIALKARATSLGLPFHESVSAEPASKHLQQHQHDHDQEDQT